MAKIISLLSGKGGSGKTTLALSMASMLSDCGIKVLLIDSDLSTNGATYFYENRLSEHGGNTSSFYNIIFGLDSQEEQLISIAENMDFLPSITQITKKNTETYSYTEGVNEFSRKIRNKFSNEYDVIIFDCQAGYTDSLKQILPIVDINLVVMEADAISSASIRSLYLKIGDFLNEKKIYQVFNKATDEEYQIYSKISGGTVFTNIETIKFDWKIRKAFSVAEIPNMKRTSADYGVQIYSICKILFKEENIKAQLNKYKIVIELNKNAEEEKQLEKKIYKLEKEKSKLKSKANRMLVTAIAGTLTATICSFFYTLVDRRIFSDNAIFFPMMILLLTMIISIFFACITLMESTKERRNHYRQAEVYRKQLEMIVENQQELKKKYQMFDGTKGS